jgi:predicted DNA-binding transcriptional regulator AlpA
MITTMTQKQVQPEWLLTGELLEILRVKRSTFDRWLAKGLFPPGVRFGEGRGTRRWRRADIEAWLREREAVARGA